MKIPEYGDMAAVYLCQKMKIGSQNEKEKLAEAKKEVYLKGFYEGVSVTMFSIVIGIALRGGWITWF